MQDIPEDISNKKFLSTEVPPEQPIVLAVDNIKISENQDPPKESKDNNIHEKTHLKKFPKIKAEPLLIRLRKRKEHFIKVQYPILYSKFYDLYNFDLVGNNTLDLVLKILILLTLIFLVGVVLMVFVETIRYIY